MNAYDVFKLDNLLFSLIYFHHLFLINVIISINVDFSFFLGFQVVAKFCDTNKIYLRGGGRNIALNNDQIYIYIYIKVGVA